ncbi:MAG TPA: hypothetical protein VH575_26575 [Gemmataceae bacterium]|jgi:hypothetical protein
MTSTSRLLGILLVCAALLLSFTDVPVEWLHELLAETDTVREHISLVEEHWKDVRLTQEVDVVRERLLVKDKVVERLIAGEITLFQAGASFLALHDSPELLARLRQSFPSSSDSESACRQVIAWTAIRVRATQSPEQSETVRQRLEAELREHLERDGTAELPE